MWILNITLQCKPAGLTYFCWPWESWGISVRRSRLSNPPSLRLFYSSRSFSPLHLSTHLPPPPLSSLPCLAIKRPSATSAFKGESLLQSQYTHTHKHSYYVLKVWKRHFCFLITHSTQSLLAVILDSLLNQQSADTGLLGPFRPVFTLTGQS